MNIEYEEKEKEFNPLTLKIEIGSYEELIAAIKIFGGGIDGLPAIENKDFDRITEEIKEDVLDILHGKAHRETGAD